MISYLIHIHGIILFLVSGNANGVGTTIEANSQLELYIFGSHGNSNCCTEHPCYIGIALCNTSYAAVDLAPLMVPQAHHLGFYVVGPWGEWLPFEGPERRLNYPQRTQLEPSWCLVDQHDISELFSFAVTGTYAVRAKFYDPKYGRGKNRYTVLSSVLQLKMKRKGCEGKGMGIAQPLEPPEDIDYFESIWAIKKKFVGIWLASRAYPLAILF